MGASPVTQPAQKGLKVALALVGPPQGHPAACTQVERAVQAAVVVAAAYGYGGLLADRRPSGAQGWQQPQARLVQGKDSPQKEGATELP